MSISSIGQAGLSPVAPTAERVPAGGAGFARVIHDALARANALDAEANQAVQDLATGRAEDVHTVMLAVAKADLAFRMILEVRNRLTEALQEVLRMQV